MDFGSHASFGSAATHLSRTHSSLAVSVQRLATGLRVGRAADDPAGLAVSVNLEVASVSQRQAMRNINDGMSMVQVAEAATGEVVDVLQRMRDLSVQSSSEGLTSDERAYLDLEYQELLGEIDRVAGSVEFNGQSLLDSGVASVSIQVGGGTGPNSRVTLSFTDMTTTSLGVDGTDIGTVGTARGNLATVDAALDTSNLARASYGAVFRRLGAAFDLAERQEVNLRSAASIIRDTDYATETTRLSALGVQVRAGVGAAASGLRALEGTTALVGGGGSGGPPVYEKGDFPEDLV